MERAREASLVIRDVRVYAAVVVLAALGATITAAHASAAGSAAQVKVEKTALGPILVDAKNRTLYMFAADKGGKSVCYGSCATYWPPLAASSSHVLGTGVKAALLGTTKRTGGTLQVTYAGHPLYLFVKDTKPGQTSGQGLNASGGLWWVISPTGAVIKKATASAAKTTTSTTTTAGGGYGG
jgi:predicted lipoprotein with Yx(FWY)xxD motif